MYIFSDGERNAITYGARKSGNRRIIVLLSILSVPRADQKNKNTKKNEMEVDFENGFFHAVHVPHNTHQFHINHRHAQYTHTYTALSVRGG